MAPPKPKTPVKKAKLVKKNKPDTKKSVRKVKKQPQGIKKQTKTLSKKPKPKPKQQTSCQKGCLIKTPTTNNLYI